MARDAGAFGRPTSDDTIYVTTGEPANTDRGKDAAYIPARLWLSHFLCAEHRRTADTEPCGRCGIRGGRRRDGSAAFYFRSDAGNTGSYTPVKYTPVTKDLYYSGGYLGTLKIPTLGLSVKVYQGTDSDALRKGAGHFTSTSIWEGNVAIAGHNRGVNNHFGKIHTLSIGDTIKLTTLLGTRSYEVYSVRKISVDDISVLNDNMENIITLVTCVMNQPEYRWCVQARQK